MLSTAVKVSEDDGAEAHTLVAPKAVARTTRQRLRRRSGVARRKAAPEGAATEAPSAAAKATKTPARRVAKKPAG